MRMALICHVLGPGDDNLALLSLCPSQCTTLQNFYNHHTFVEYIFQVVQEYERAVIFRLGRLLPGGAKGPGIDSIIFLQNSKYHHFPP